MLAITILAYVASASILFCYWLVTKDHKHVHKLNWANGVGAIPLIIVEGMGHAWPAMIVTGAFGILGFAGVLTHHRE